MKLQFKYQKFQADAAKTICDIFAGQPYYTPTYLIDKGVLKALQVELNEDEAFVGVRNSPIETGVAAAMLERVQKTQREQFIKPDAELAAYPVELEDPITAKKEKRLIKYNFTVEMETGVGKTYTYIKTMYELNKRYGWSKFVIIVPSVAIREGVNKTFEITQEHFAEEYGKKIHFFIYNSSHLDEIDHFAQNASINVMIINSQAFNAKGKDARRIYMRLDSFRSRRPIDIIAKTNPILIIDEPQSVEGKQTKNNIGWFAPLFMLRYSATPKEQYNVVYRLDAMEAYNKKLVKKIAVKGISESGTTSTEGYLYLQSVIISKQEPAAVLEFEARGKTGVRKITRRVTERDKFNLYDNSDGMEEYRNNFIVTTIDGRDNSLTFLNGRKIYAGVVYGAVNDGQLRHIQIRETILSHLERESRLFHKGIKVLSLFFIDEVAKYKQYENGRAFNGEYATIFEEEYQAIVNNTQMELGQEDYIAYLKNISASSTHAGYFSIDKQKHFVNSSVERGTGESSDKDAYDLIMRNKERLLDFAEPVRFIFSHSALREGWDNPNVFQICTLKKSGSDIRKRQEVGRGLRLCVNRNGERMDANAIAGDVHDINVLTVIANESYDAFTKTLQNELAEDISARPQIVNAELFAGKTIQSVGGTVEIDKALAVIIHEGLIAQGYVKKGQLTEKYYADVKSGVVFVADEVTAYTPEIIKILDTIYNPAVMKPEDARKNNVTLSINEEQFARKEFRELWNRINTKSAYSVRFDSDELIRKAIGVINAELVVSSAYFKVTEGVLNTIASKEALQNGVAFQRKNQRVEEMRSVANTTIKYDLIGKLIEETGLTRAAIVAILKGIAKDKFALFSQNPEEFIIKTAVLINEQKATVIVQYIEYTLLNECYDTSIFTDPALKGRLDVNAVAANKHLFDYVLYDSSGERAFAHELDTAADVVVYVKLPKTFYINTPVGNYSPDWAVAFHEGSVKHIYFVAETKGSMDTLELREIENAKINCARRHFEKIGAGLVTYDKVDTYKTLLDKVMR